MDITLREAIEVLEKERKDHHSYPTDIIGQAEALGIEALKRVKNIRFYPKFRGEALLPGERVE